MQRRNRVIIARPDGHDRKVIARALRDTGFEVIGAGRFQTADQVALACVSEDADAVGPSVLPGAHRSVFPRVAG